MIPLAEDQSAPSQYCVVMGDLVQSEASVSTNALHRDFNLAVEAANAAYRPDLASPLTITLGDEFQGLVRNIDAALSVTRKVRWQLLENAVPCRFVIGMVSLATPLNPDRAWNMMGPGLATAREILDHKRDPNAYRFSLPGQPTLEILMNGVGRALTDIEAGWTARQREVMFASFSLEDSGAALAQRFEIKESVFYKIRRAAKFDLYSTLWSALRRAAIMIDEQQSHHDNRPDRALTRDPWPLLDVVYYLAGLIALTWGGNWVCRMLLTWSGITLPPTEASATLTPPVSSPMAAPTPSVAPGVAPAVSASASVTPATTAAPSRPATSARAGRMIGSLERLIIFLGLMAGSWEIIAAVIALKTVGRFKELDQQLHAEYFLIGSLASMVWATAVSLTLIWFDRHLGFNISGLFAKAS